MVPDLPTPALQWITMGRCSGLTRSRKARTNLRSNIHPTHCCCSSEKCQMRQSDNIFKNNSVSFQIFSMMSCTLTLIFVVSASISTQIHLFNLYFYFHGYLDSYHPCHIPIISILLEITNHILTLKVMLQNFNFKIKIKYLKKIFFWLRKQPNKS